MRSLILLVVLLGFIPVSWISPFVGVLVWCWLSFMIPHQLVWGLATELRLNLVISIVTILGFLFSRESKSITPNASIFLIFIFAFLWVVSAQLAMVPKLTDPLLSRHLKTFVLLLMIMMLVNNRVRLHSLVLVIVLSIGYYAVYGGLVGILSGGGSRFHGPPASPLHDNNHLALAIVVTLPLVNYLRIYSERVYVRYALIGVMGLGVIAVLVTYSRGGFLGLLTMGAVFWWKSKHKIATLIVAAILVVPAFQLMPEEWWDRMDTIETAAEEDSSFQQRLYSWETAFNLAVENPILGGGFSATQSEAVYQRYRSFGDHNNARAAHSIYFQVLGDMGFVGLAVFMLIFFSCWLNSLAVIKGAKGNEDLQWAGDLAKMLQVSMAGYLVAGAALSMAYYDVTLTMVVIMANLRAFVEKSKAQQVQFGPVSRADLKPFVASRFEK